MGKNIKDEREKLGYSQEELAELIDCTPQTISNAEHGNKNSFFSIILIIKMAHYFDISMDWLCGFDCPEYIITKNTEQITPNSFNLRSRIFFSDVMMEVLKLKEKK